MEAVETHMISMYWETHQLEFQDDIKQFHSKDGLKTENVSHEVNKEILTKILNLFTQMDIAAGTLYCRLLPHVQNNEVRNWFMVAAARESTHQRAYAAIVEALGFPETSWEEFMSYAEMQEKIDTMLANDDLDCSTRKGFLKTLAQLFLAEGIALFGSFACMLNLRRYGLMQGTNKVNEWSLKDEEEHVNNNMKIFKNELELLSKEEKLEMCSYVKSLAKSLAECEFHFLDLVFNMGNQEGMTKQDMKEYIKYLVDFRMVQLGYKPIYNVDKNPLGWMDWVLSGKKHTNFFEERVVDYSHEGLSGAVDYNKYVGIIDAAN